MNGTKSAFKSSASGGAIIELSFMFLISKLISPEKFLGNWTMDLRYSDILNFSFLGSLKKSWKSYQLSSSKFYFISLLLALLEYLINSWSCSIASISPHSRLKESLLLEGVKDKDHSSS